jgi:primosomal protein N'
MGRIVSSKELRCVWCGKTDRPRHSRCIHCGERLWRGLRQRLAAMALKKLADAHVHVESSDIITALRLHERLALHYNGGMRRIKDHP